MNDYPRNDRERWGLESRSISGGIFWGIMLGIGLYFLTPFLLRNFTDLDAALIAQLQHGLAIGLPLVLFLFRTTRGWLFWLGAFLPWG